MVSIIIPCYNQAEFLPDTLANLQQQTMHNFECVVVDDGSTDDSAEIVRKTAAVDPRFRLIQKPNGGSATARNLGLQVARGEYVQFLDADDSLDKDKLAKQVEFMQRNQLDYSCTDWLYLFEDEKHHVTWQKHTSIKSRILFSLRFSLLTRWGIDFSFPPNAFLYRMDFLQRNGLRFSESIRYREDWDYLLNVSRCPGRFGQIQDYVGAFYRQNPHGKTSSASKMANGNFIYLDYKCQELPLGDFLLFSYRLSNELIMLLGRTAKFRDFSMLSNVRYLLGKGKSAILLCLALLFLPLALLHVFIRSVLEYSVD